MMLISVPHILRILTIGLTVTVVVGLEPTGAKAGRESGAPLLLVQYTPYPPPGNYYPPPSRPPCNIAGGAFYGAARGAAGGAIFGAIAGNAGRGAAIGAGIGALGAASRRAAARNYGYCH